MPVRVVICIGTARASFGGQWLTIPVLYAWSELAGRRVEVSRPLGASGIWGIVPADIKPVIKIRI